MSNFRRCFDDYLRGGATIDATASALTEDLQREPGLVAVRGAFIEAMYRGGALPGEGYEALMRTIHAAQPKREIPASDRDGDSGDKTVLRPGKRPLRKGEPVAADTDSSLTGTNVTTGSTTGSTWSDPAHWTASSAGPIGTGSIVKARFVLEEPIGKGGMGTVYKARDLRKEEAQDRNPYVAIKTLNEDFKRHPQALRALQREARKAQALAHPNIVTVYDFDRDGTDVYMVMELLEGESLDRLIKRSEGAGIGSEQAWRIAIEICRGMAFAHQRGIVHADFKPANVFLTREGAVKIFDFGIARAVKRGEREGTFTVFDPATLGALTPAYASCEVIEGLEPDARDDVYAIGCVIYELLTGTHPFKRMSADVAKEAKAVAARPAGLSWWRWRALRQALDFRREQRPVSAAQLLAVFRGAPRPTTRQIGIAAAFVTVVAAIVIGIALVPGMLAQDRESDLLAALRSADRARIETALPDLRALEGTPRAALLLDDAARTGLIRYFKTRIDEVIDASQGRYNYSEADALLRELQGYLTDSLAVRELADRLAARKNEEIGRQREWLDQHIERGVLISEQGSPNVIGVLDIVRSIDPSSRLLNDPRLPGAFAQQTRAALQAGDTDLAEALVTRGLSLHPNDAMLVDLRDQVKHAASPARQAPASPQNVASISAATEIAKPAPVQSLSEEQLRSQLAAGMAKPGLTLAQARQLAEIAKDLSRRGVADAMALERALKIRLANDAMAMKRRRGVDAALAFAEGSYTLFPDSPVLKKTLAELRQAAVQRDEQRQVVAVERIKQNIETLLASALDDSWPAAIEGQLQQLAAAVPADDTYFSEARQRTAALYIRRAIELRRAQRITEAGRMLERGREFGADPAAVLAEEKLLAEARAQQQLDDKARARVAQLTALKEKLLVQAQANQVIDALFTLEQLRPSLPKKDNFVTEEAPRAIARGYLRLASTTIKEGRFKEAINLVDRARDLDRSSDEVAAVRKRYTRYQSVDGILASRRRIDAQDLRKELAELAKPDPDEAAVIMSRLARTLVTRINTTQDVEDAARLAAAARELFMPEVIPARPADPADGAPASGAAAPVRN